MDGSSSNMETNAMLTYASDSASFCFKLLPFLQNSEKIKKCINFFGKKNFAPKTDHEKQIIDECIWVCRRNSIVYFYGMLLVMIVWYFPVFFIKGRQLPLHLWLPYDPSSTTVNYYFTLVYMAAAIAYDGYCGTIMDPLIAGLTYHATAQLKILKYNLKHLDKHLEHNSSKSLYTNMKNVSLGAYSVSLLEVPLNSIEAFTYTGAIFSVSIQIYFHCHYGTLLFEENNGLIKEIYMGPWYKYDTEIRKHLLIVMERSKRPLLITAGKVVDVTVKTFVSVLKTSYSLIAAFNNYN
ncbi:odorant receptor 23a-like [Zophobas morio]|uniref:odorant receptor 23a-like n=1 Tax=Zophobas morio TaxID=2755281 RepID=UPI003082C55B